MSSEEVQMLQSMFPGLSAEVIRQAIRDANGDADRAVDSLLNLQTIQDSDSFVPAPQPEPRRTPVVAPKPVTPPIHHPPARTGDQMLSDEMFALSLMQEEQMLADAQMAWQIQQQENSRSSYSYRPPTYVPPPPRSYSPEPPAPTFELTDEIVKEAGDAFIKNFLPTVLKQLKDIEVPDIDEKLDVPKVGEIHFGVKGLALGDVNVAGENVSFKLLEGQVLEIHMTNLAAKLSQFDWFYKKKSFPKLKDSGKADATLSKISIHVRVAIQNSGRLDVQNTDVKVGNLDIHITGTKASFLYKLVISLFSSSIKQALENGLTSVVKDTLDGGMDNLTDLLQGGDGDSD
jgi:hypothetical protein